jgi:hypothetical protein
VDRLGYAARCGDRVMIDELLMQSIPGFVPGKRPWDVTIAEPGTPPIV